MSSFPAVTTSVAPPPSDSELRLQVEVLSGFSEEAPARVVLRLSDLCGADRKLRTGGHPPPFGPLWSTDHPTEIALPLTPRHHPDESAIPDSPVNGCWRLTAGIAIYDAGSIWVTGLRETIEQEYWVVADHRSSTEDCLHPGKYQFPLEVEEHDETASYSLEFTLTLGEQ